ncbi:MAG: carboxypeptidase-like regulatory domain-containing protein, partial [Alistipes sp.]|nr:carboxypeptidase-like regulatory domain-containing protein [Alistipes sp.]
MMQNLLKLALLTVVLLFTSLGAYAQGGEVVTVSGVVTSAEDKQPLIGVTVVTEKMTGVATSIDGDYTIEAEAGTKLMFQYIGFQTVEWVVPAGSPQVTYNLEMQSESHSVEEVVVIAYGVRKKGTVAGSVSTVKAEKIEKTPTAAFDQALQGQVAGLSVLSNTGEPSAAAVMTIRGTNSINSGTAPLY